MEERGDGSMEAALLPASVRLALFFGPPILDLFTGSAGIFQKVGLSTRVGEEGVGACVRIPYVSRKIVSADTARRERGEPFTDHALDGEFR